MAEHEGRLDALYHRALEIDAERREAFIERECADDPEIAELLRELLTNAPLPDDRFLGGDASIDAPSAASELGIPDRLGRYRIVRELGRGGMGVVYEAEQEDPTRRVALKVLRTGFVSGSLVSRFRREAQALAQLQHRGIAHIYESGSARVGNDDVPFFAMEYIGGRPLDKHAEANALSARQKLELVARVCDAVQHAHQKGVIHRDLKPSNVLVVEESTGTGQADDTGTVIDAIGQPKILDFGIARFTDADVHATVQTSTGQIVGTLAYMSPEQVDGRPEELDTRCDVYALGVMLYALLAGRTPHDLGGMPVAEAARTIKEDEPPSLGALDGALRGDIATIAAKAIDKDRDRRYASAGLMAEDIRRYLRDEPIAARPASTLYQLRKFARRNKALVGGVAASFALLVLGVVGTSLGLAWALRANADLGVANSELTQANSALEQANTDLERANAELSRVNDNIEAVVRFQNDMLRSVDVAQMGEIIRRQLLRVAPEKRGSPVQPRYQDVDFASVARDTLHEALYMPAIEDAKRKLGSLPVVQARLLSYMAARLQHLGYPETAADLILQPLGLFRAHLGDEHNETLLCEAMAVSFLIDYGDFQTARELALHNLEVTRRVRPQNHHRLDAALRNMGIVHSRLGEFSEAAACFEEALQLWAETGAGGNENAAGSMMLLAGVLSDAGIMDRAESQYREALVFARDALDDESAITIAIHADFGLFLVERGSREDGVRMLRTALSVSRRVRGDNHPGTLGIRRRLVRALIPGSDFAEAEGHALEIERIVRAAHGSRSDEASEAADLLVSLYEAWHEAEPNKGYDAEAARWRAASGSRGAAGD